MIRAALLTSWLLPSVALAAGGGGHHEPASITTLFLPVFNFLLFVGVLYKYAWPSIREALAGRREDVLAMLDRGKQALDEAKSDLAAARSLQSGQAAEAEELLVSVREEAAQQAAAIVAAAKETALRIRRDAELVGEQESSAAASTLRREIAAAVTEKAGAKLRSEGAGSVESFLSDLESAAS